MIERDRFTRGFYAGIGAGILQNLWSFSAFALGLTTLRMADWSAIVILSKSGPFSAGEIWLGVAGHIIWCGLLGIIFAYLIPYLNHRHLTLKGLLFGLVTWFFIYGVSLLFKIEPTYNLPLKTALTDLVGATIYGLVLVFILTRLTENRAPEQKL